MKQRVKIYGSFLALTTEQVAYINELTSSYNKVEIVVVENATKNRKLMQKYGLKYADLLQRLSWLGETFADLDNVKISSVKKQDIIIFAKDATHYTFDNDIEAAKYVDTKNILEDIYNNWELVSNSCRGFFTKRIALVGTESCGKTTLAKKLAKFYNSDYVHEVGRDYCIKYKDNLTVEHFDSIAMEHFLLYEKKLEGANKVLFIDSEAVVTQYYLDMYYQIQSPLIDNIIAKQDYNLVLFLEPDVEWVADEIRFAGDDNIRIKNNDILKQMLTDKNIAYKCISGDYQQRYKSALELIEDLF